MYFKWGTKEKKVVETTIDGALCPHCAANQFTIASWVSYFFIYWIPFFIKKRKIVISCSTCKKNINTETIPEDFYKRIHSLAFPPFKLAPYYSGIPLTLIIVYLGIYLFTIDDKTQDTLFSEPLINDVYFIQYSKLVSESNNEFGYLKLENISDNQLGFKISKKSYDEYFKSTQDLHNDNVYQNQYYGNKILYISKPLLVKYKEKRIIKRIHRHEILNEF